MENLQRKFEIFAHSVRLNLLNDDRSTSTYLRFESYIVMNLLFPLILKSLILYCLLKIQLTNTGNLSLN